MYKISAGGRKITLYRIHGGECCPLMSLSILGESEYDASACVETAGSVLMIPSQNFRNLIQKYPK
jgi:CRP/FNR family transcriptional regulator